MEILQNLIFNTGALIVTLGILVTFHEYGHFWVARRCGVKVERFSVGFGKPLWRWQPGETEYVLAAIPLGGYVKMLGDNEREEPLSDAEGKRAFNRQSLAKRSAIIAAGPVANFLLAIVLYWITFIVGSTELAPVVGNVSAGSPAAEAGLRAGQEIVAVDGRETQTWQDVRMGFLQRLGESGSLALRVQSADSTQEQTLTIPLDRWLIGTADPDTLAALGMTPYRVDIPARIALTESDSRAQQAGIQVGDLILEAQGRPITGWFDWVEVVRQHPEQPLSLLVQRGNSQHALNITPARRQDESGEVHGYIGAGVEEPAAWPAVPEEMMREVRYSPFAAIPQAIGQTWETSVFVLQSLKKMVVGLISVENLSGPVTIAQVAGQTASYGLEYFVGFLAVLSISLGVLNLLPIPMLDGGHLLYNLVEFATRRPVSERIQQVGLQLGLLLIISFTLIAFYNDFNRLL